VIERIPSRVDPALSAYVDICFKEVGVSAREGVSEFAKTVVMVVDSIACRAYYVQVGRGYLGVIPTLSNEIDPR
jgi:hypothetical protein